MGQRVGTLVLLILLLSVGAFAGSALSQWWQQTPGTGMQAAGGPMGARGEGGGAEGSPSSAAAERVRVEVLNGGGRPNMARSATEALRDAGFDVVYFGNAGTFERDSSVVLARTDRLEWARSVADALGIREVRSEPDENLYLDVTVVLGQEWLPEVGVDADAEPAPAPPARPEVPWWDPRTWFPQRPMEPGRARQLADPPSDTTNESGEVR